MNIRIFPPEEILDTTVNHLPLSKSISARELVMAALTPGASLPAKSNLADCDDIDVLAKALLCRRGEVTVHSSGTALRFLTAFFAAADGAEVTLTGSARLCERPVGPIVDALRSLGADITYTGREGFAPLKIRGKKLKGGAVALDASSSSQFASALAMVAPTMSDGLTIDLGGQIPSAYYLKMTVTMMRLRGIDASMEGYSLRIAPGTYQPYESQKEVDWTAASYWYAIAAVTAGWVKLPDMETNSLQGDAIMRYWGERIGVLSECHDYGIELSATPDIYSRLDIDMSDFPDLVPTLAVAASLIGMPWQFTGIANLRIKESDRIAALHSELRKFGFVTEATANSLGWEGEREPVMKMPEVDPHGDHRIAMAFAVASIFVPGMIILDSEVVVKSYPGFYEDLREAGFSILDADAPLPEPTHEA